MFAPDPEADHVHRHVRTPRKISCQRTGRATARVLSVGHKHDHAGLPRIIQHGRRLSDGIGQGCFPLGLKTLDFGNHAIRGIGHRSKAQLHTVALGLGAGSVGDQPHAAHRRHLRHDGPHGTARVENARLVQKIESHLGHRPRSVEDDHRIAGASLLSMQRGDAHTERQDRSQNRFHGSTPFPVKAPASHAVASFVNNL